MFVSRRTAPSHSNVDAVIEEAEKRRVGKIGRGDGVHRRGGFVARCAFYPTNRMMNATISANNAIASVSANAR